MKKGCKYDVAISFAEEDLLIAKQLADAFRERDVRYYLFTEDEAFSLGRDLIKISIEKYMKNTLFVLVLISKHYGQRQWSKLELEIARAVIREEYILPVRIDDAVVNGLSPNMVFKRWNNNADDIAAIIKKKVEKKKESQTTKKKKTTKKKMHSSENVYQEGRNNFNHSQLGDITIN